MDGCFCLTFASFMLLATTLLVFTSWRKDEDKKKTPNRRPSPPIPLPTLEFQEGIMRSSKEHPLFATGQYD